MSNYNNSPTSGGFEKSDDVELAREALGRLCAARADDRDSWLKIGMALHAVSPSLLSEWIAYSRTSEKFKEGECERQWKGFKPDKAQSIGIGTLIRWAREDSGDENFGKPSARPRLPDRFGSLEHAEAALSDAIGAMHVRTWRYDRADHTPAFWVARFDEGGVDPNGKRKKTYRPIHRTADGRYLVGDPAGPLPLYRLRELSPQGLTFLLEGEKAADAGAALGLTTTTTAHGAGSVKKSDLSPLAGRDVAVLRDNDSSGAKYAQDAERALLALNPPAVVRQVLLPGLPAGGDIVEYIAAERAAGKDEAQIRARIGKRPARVVPAL